MELRQLRYFLAVAEERRFARAAERLHIAAPSLSQQIQALERELRATLFERSPQRVVLTRAGEALVQRARVILAEAERARDDVRAARGERRDELRLRVCNMAELVLDGPLHLAALGIPGLAVSVASSPGDDAIEAVRQGRADAAVVWSRSFEQRDLEGTVLGEVGFGIAVPQEHPLSGLAAVPVARLGGETMVMFPRQPFAGIWDRVVTHLLPAGPGSHQVVIEPDLIGAPEAMMRAVAAGVGVAPVILGIDGQVGVPGVEVRPLDPPLGLELELVWRAHPQRPLLGLLRFLVQAAGDSHAAIGPRPAPPGAEERDGAPGAA
ncbi:MAG: DNA-binding transcriptional regulator, LysR family [Modestobacter sp.]|nr:DNA-binding transcriptional regulator, LysR family [Modestobacter sp.]